MSVAWDLCSPDDQMVGYDLAHWQGTVLPWPACVALGVEVVIAKTWHGAGRVVTAEAQLDGARAAGVPILSRYGWCDPLQDPTAQALKMASTEERGHLRMMLDVEQPVKGWAARALLTHAERVVEVFSDKTGRRPLLYTGTWYWVQFLGNLDSPIMAECDLVVAAYPRLKALGIEYRAAAEEACRGSAPAIPLPWASRGIQPLGWQFDGDRGLYIPNEAGEVSKADVDVNVFSRSRLTALLDSPEDNTLPGTGVPRRDGEPEDATVEIGQDVVEQLRDMLDYVK